MGRAGESKGADFGPAVNAAGPLERFPRAKNAVLSKAQTSVLDTFGWLSEHSRADALVARLARRWIGTFLYSVKLEVNATCSLRCRMCYVRPSTAQLEPELLEELYRQLRGCGVRIEILGGEPLMRPDIVQIVEGAKRRARSPFVTMYTNGVSAHPALARGLRRAGLDACIVTLVSHRSKTHDAFCGVKGAWEQTVAGAGYLRDAGIEVYTLTAVHRENVEDCAEIDAFVREEMGCHPTFYQYVPQRRDDPLSIDRQSWARVKHWVLSEQNPDHMRFVRRFFLLTGNACSGGNFVLTVKANGSVQPCPFVSDIELGNLHEQDIWTIYRRRFEKPGLVAFKRLPPECEPCAYRSVCGGGCRAAGGTLFGRYDRMDHQCLGPYAGRLDRARVTDCAPTFF